MTNVCVSPLRCNRLGWRCSFQGLGTRVFSVTVFGHPGGAIFIMKKKTEQWPQGTKKKTFSSGSPIMTAQEGNMIFCI